MPFCKPYELDYYISPDGQRYVFDNTRDKLLMTFDGLGMPGIDYVTQQGPFQHGQTLLDYRLQTRIIQHMHRRVACDRQGYWENRGDTINLLRPNRQLAGTFGMGVLRKIMPGNFKRDIDVLVQQGPIFGPQATDSMDDYGWTETIRFIAPDPTFYDPDAVSIVWTINNLGGLYFYSALYPNDLFGPWVFGTDVLSEQADIHYTGTWHTYPTITIDGPLNIPLIENQTLSEKIELTYNVAAGERVTIELPFGNKQVYNNAGTNLIGVVTTDSDLATFRIAPEPEATHTCAHARPCGVNLINVSGNNGVVGQTAVELSYKIRYIGI